MVDLTVETILVQDSEPISALVEEQVVVLSARAGSYFGFNRVGSEIWDMLAEPRHVREIFDTLSRSYDVESDILARDVTLFLQKLLERRLLRVVYHGHSR
jgi:hypothetical protein